MLSSHYSESVCITTQLVLSVLKGKPEPVLYAGQVCSRLNMQSTSFLTEQWPIPFSFNQVLFNQVSLFFGGRENIVLISVWIFLFKAVVSMMLFSSVSVLSTRGCFASLKLAFSLCIYLLPLHPIFLPSGPPKQSTLHSPHTNLFSN